MSDDKNYINFDDDLNQYDIDEESNISNDNIEEDNNIDVDDDIINNDDDNDFIDIDDVSDIEDCENFDIIYKFNTNKHRQEGKHRLQRDTIFKGKLDKKENEDNISNSHIDNDYDNINIFDIHNDSDDYLSTNDLTKDVYDILDKNTDLDFKQNRRKPNKEVFNNYYNLLIRELGYRYTRSEIFVELSYYFTDNIFNMFKLLDKKPATYIIKELTQKGFLKNLNGINFL